MPTRDPRVDAFIAKSQPFARPILAEIRRRMHQACPGLEETIKWGAPFFMFDHQMLASMAGFKTHARLLMWGVESDPTRALKLTSVAQLPPAAAFNKTIKAAAKRLLEGTAARAPKKDKGPVVVPAELAAALKKNAAARKAFARFAPGYRRDYALWISEAKRPETRAQRVGTAVEWIAQGKSRNWKYER